MILCLEIISLFEITVNKSMLASTMYDYHNKKTFLVARLFFSFSEKKSHEYLLKNYLLKGELRAKFYPNFFFIYRFVYAYYNVVQNFIIFGKGFRKL